MANAQHYSSGLTTAVHRARNALLDVKHRVLVPGANYEQARKAAIQAALDAGFTRQQIDQILAT